MKILPILLLTALLGSGARAQSTFPTTAPTPEPLTEATTVPTTTTAVGPVTMPATLPSTQATAESNPGNRSERNSRRNAMPREYAVLTERSLFMKTRPASDLPPRNYTPPSTTSAESSSARAERSMVFNGATEVDGVGIAIFEDTAAGKILKFKVGDAIARGTIKRITIAGLEYEVAGRVIPVSIGQTLEGTEAPDLMSRAVVTNSPSATQPTTSPADGVGGSNDVLERLRAKRRQELGQ